MEEGVSERTGVGVGDQRAQHRSQHVNAIRFPAVHTSLPLPLHSTLQNALGGEVVLGDLVLQDPHAAAGAEAGRQHLGRAAAARRGASPAAAAVRRPSSQVASTATRHTAQPPASFASGSPPEATQAASGQGLGKHKAAPRRSPRLLNSHLGQRQARLVGRQRRGIKYLVHLPICSERTMGLCSSGETRAAAPKP